MLPFGRGCERWRWGVRRQGPGHTNHPYWCWTTNRQDQSGQHSQARRSRLCLRQMSSWTLDECLPVWPLGFDLPAEFPGAVHRNRCSESSVLWSMGEFQAWRWRVTGPPAEEIPEVWRKRQERGAHIRSMPLPQACYDGAGLLGSMLGL